MKKKNTAEQVSFGERLTTLRKNVGLTQQELADEIGVSRRAIAHYETTDDVRIAVTLIPKLAKTLGIKVDTLIGLDKVKSGQNGAAHKNRLWRRLQKLQNLPSQKRRQVINLIDAFLSGQ